MIFLVTGASSSGKSQIAEDIAVKCGGSLIYIATMHKRDSESIKRIIKHQEMRKTKGFTTIEKYVSIEDIHISKENTCLIECMSNLLANEMYEPNGSKDQACEKILTGIYSISKKAKNLIVVTNEVFSDGNRYDSFCEKYIKNLGVINSEIARLSDYVIESVVGIPIYHKGIIDEDN